MADELVAASAGIFGVLSKILADAQQRSEFAGRRAITKRDITDSYYGEVDYKKMWADVKFFQTIMKSANTKAEATVAASAWGLKKKDTESAEEDPKPGAATAAAGA